MVYPPHFDPSKKYPVLLFCEGGPQSPVSQFWSYRWNLQIMAANDYIVIAPNRRGLPGFGMEWLEEISGDYSGQCMQDYLSAIDDICKEPYADKDRLGCVGASFGGYSVYYLAGHHDKRFKCFISHDGIFNTQQQYYETEEMWFPNWDLGAGPWRKGISADLAVSYTHLAINLHLTYVPYLTAAKELKTKPTQTSVKQLQSLGIQPDILVLRTEHELNADIRKKVAHFCNVDEEAVIQSLDMPSIYEVPLSMQAQKLDAIILRKMNMPVGETPQLGPWRSFLDRRNKATEIVHIALVGKYDLQDAYKSILESLAHAGTYNDYKVKTHFVNSEKLTHENVEEQLKGMAGVVICPGFGQRGTEGKIIAAEYTQMCIRDSLYILPQQV